MMKYIPGYEGLYSVTVDGRVYSHYINDYKIQTDHCQGYKIVTLKGRDGKKRTKLVHRMVAMTFMPNPENYRCINHINGNKQDNRIENLEWCSHKQNTKHAIATKLVNPHRTDNRRRGKDNPESRPVIQLNIVTSEIIARYDNIREAHRKTGANASNIGAVASGRRTTCGGYAWLYATE